MATFVRDIMDTDPVTVGEDASAGHNRLPVVEHGRLVGVVTRVGVLDALVGCQDG